MLYPVSLRLRKWTTVIATCTLGITGIAQGPYFNWVKQLGSVADSDQSFLVMEPDGSLLTAGLFEGSADFDHSDSELMFNASSSKDIFITKTAPNGDFIWAKQISSINNLDNLYLNALTNDDQGNFYMTGSYISTVDFDPDPQVEYLVDEVDPSNYDQDIFIAKYSPDGNLIWVKTIGSFNTDFGRSLEITSNGHLIVTGEFEYNVDFDPGPEVATLSTLNNSIFILTLTEDGEFVDAKFISGSTNSLDVYRTKIDANDNLYLVGGFYGTVDFDPGQATYSVTASGSGATRFICKLDHNLSCVWAKRLNVTSLSAVIRDFEIDADESILMAGSFWGGIDLDPADDASFDLVSAGYSDSFVAKLDATGTFVWGKQFGGTDSDEAIAIEFTNQGQLLVGMNIRSTSLDIDPGMDIQLLTNGGSYDLALVELSNNGDFINYTHITGSQIQQVNDLIVTPTAVYTSGTFAGSTDFDPGTGVTSLYPDESWDYFIHKMSFIPSHVENQKTETQMILYPNPTNGIVNISMVGTKENMTVEVYDYMGTLLDRMNTKNQTFTIDLTQMPAGVYMIKSLDTDGNIITQTVIKQ